MQKIRKAVMDDKSLSTYAHNVKIIAQNGKVTLKGPVRSEDEKKMVEQKPPQLRAAATSPAKLPSSPKKAVKNQISEKET